VKRMNSSYTLKAYAQVLVPQVLVTASAVLLLRDPSEAVFILTLGLIGGTWEYVSNRRRAASGSEHESHVKGPGIGKPTDQSAIQKARRGGWKMGGGFAGVAAFLVLYDLIFNGPYFGQLIFLAFGFLMAVTSGVASYRIEIRRTSA
jgi:hypothetical protein